MGDTKADLRTPEPEKDLMAAIEPTLGGVRHISHYYGDVARGLLIGAAALSLVASPLYASSTRWQFIFIVGGAFASVIAAAFTDPHRRGSLMADAVVSGAGMIVYAGWGIFDYDYSAPVAFVLRLAVAILFLFAFYFSLKTVRAFALHEIGKAPLEEVEDIRAAQRE